MNAPAAQGPSNTRSPAAFDIPPLPDKVHTASEFAARCQRLGAWLRERGDFAGEVMLPATITRLLTMELRTTARRLGLHDVWAETCRRAERATHFAIARARTDGTLRAFGGARGSGPSLVDYGLPRTWIHKSIAWGVTLSDVDFEDALAAARETGALSQVRFGALLAARGDSPQARRCLTILRTMAASGYGSDAIAAKLDLASDRVRALAREAGIAIPADATTARQRRIDPTRLVPQTISALDALTQGIDLIDATDLASIPADQRRDWADDLDLALKTLRTLTKELRRAQ